MESNEFTVLDSQELGNQNKWKLFFVFGNLLFGALSFAISLGLQMNLYLLNVAREREGVDVLIISASTNVKIFVISFALIGIFCGWRYLKSGEKKMKIVNLFGLVLGCFAIVFVLIPFYFYL